MTGRTRRVLGLLLSLPGWLTFLALASPWFLAMQWRFPDFAHYFFIIQHVQRFLSRSFNNPQPVWFYPVVLLVAALPWSPWLLALRRGSRRVPPVQRDVRALMWAWLVVVTAFFSIPASKLVGYILPALPPLAFLVAEAVQRAVSRGTQPGSAAVWLQRTSLGLAAAGCVGITLAAHFYQPKSLASLAARLQAGAAPGDPVVLLKTYPYDVPFYARLRAPVVVVDAWAPADVAKDSWRRELRDAEVFSPGTSRRLLTFAELDRLVCGPATTWLVGPWPSGPETPWLASSEPIYREGRFALWQITPAHLPPILAGRCGHVGEGSP
jgi:4-amino-4-deoxy-L-arabinose transferase-like glycosyltransferase